MVLVVLFSGGVIMAYFVKKTKQGKKTFLAIYQSFYDHGKRGTAHKSYQAFGSVEALLESGIEDPIAYVQKQVDELNKTRDDARIRKITDKSPLVYLGYFPLKNIIDKLNIKHFVDIFKLTTKFNYELFDLLSSLIYARSVNPCSKYRTFHEVIPNLYHNYNYSYDQLLDGLSFLGNDYEKFVEIFTAQINKKYKLDTTLTYFDCTNFYFEIDREDDFRRLGPSKENRKSPIIGLGLLLDANQIPIGMKMYPGNQSEKPIIREVIDQLKRRNNITGRTIHVADKGLNCAANIAFSKKNGDGYIFSKSIKGLPEKEKVWVLLKQDFKEVKDKDGSTLYYYKSCIDEFPFTFEHEGNSISMRFKEKRLLTYNPALATKKKLEIHKMIEKVKALTLSKAKRAEYGEAGKYVNFTDQQGKKAITTLNQVAIDNDLQLAGYNLLVTSEIYMKDQDIYNTYHNLWRIEESFKIMKSDLDARPAFCQKEETIKGHFLICYLTVTLERIFQFIILNNNFSTAEITRFIKDFRVVRVDSKYINTTVTSKLIEHLAKLFNLPLTNYTLSDTQIKSIFNYKI